MGVLEEEEKTKDYDAPPEGVCLLDVAPSGELFMRSFHTCLFAI